MKPTFQIPQARNRRPVRFPQTDYSFRPSMHDFGGRSRDGGEPSFRRISATYFDHEARRDFASEAGYFALIVLTAAVPVVKAIGGLFQSVQSLGAL